MSKHFDPSTLPDDVARIAAAQVAAGRYPDVEAVVRAGVQAVERDAAKLETLRAALIEGEKSGVFEGDPFASVRAELGLSATTPHDWADYMRYRFAAGREAFARGEAVPTTPDALMDSIENELGLA
jgi:antitoxin ParD1/3/4